MRKPRSFPLEAERLDDAGVVAQRRVAIQRQVIGRKVDVVVKQHAQPFAHERVDYAGIAVPEQPVVHHHQPGVSRGRGFEERTAGRHRRDHGFNYRAPVNLQAHRPVVRERPDFENSV